MVKTVTEEGSRVGVFVCHCGSNIGGVVDVTSVAEYAKTLPGVAFATDNLYTCAEDGLACIRDAIIENKLDRVVVASCTPRTHAPLFQATVEEAGLNKYLFTFVNIREHCSWVHMKQKEAATHKARDLIRMGVARVKLLTSQEEPKIPVEKSALVIGGGPAGMTAALSIAKQGFPVHLVERENELGGFIRNLYTLYMTEKSPMELIKPLIQNVTSHPNITVCKNSMVSDVYGYIGNYVITIKSGDSETKTKVGTIVVATGATDYSKEGLFGYKVHKNVITLREFETMCKDKTLPQVENVAFIQCVGSRGQDKSYCSRICCTLAIKNAVHIVDNHNNILNLAEPGNTLTMDGPVEQYNTSTSDGPAEQGNTSTTDGPVEQDNISTTGVPSDGRRRRRRTRGRDEISEGIGQGAKVTIFNRDIMSYGIEQELSYNSARSKGVRFVRYTTKDRPEVIMRDDNLLVRYFHESLNMEREIPVDLVILSTPLIAQPDSMVLSKMLKVPLGQEGFFLEAHVKLRPVDFATDGIFIAGTAKGPANIQESVEQGFAAASKASIPLKRGYVQAEAITSNVDHEKCSGCATCVEICPYGAMIVNDEGLAETILAACKGCGSCAASCPERAISMNNYTDEQLRAEMLALMPTLGGDLG